MWEGARDFKHSKGQKLDANLGGTFCRVSNLERPYAVDAAARNVHVQIDRCFVTPTLVGLSLHGSGLSLIVVGVQWTNMHGSTLHPASTAGAQSCCGSVVAGMPALHKSHR